eukprot:s1779_g1.t1
MSGILETDENFEIVASTIKCIYDQTCRKCAGLNRTITYQPKDGRIQRKIRIEHNKGDTPAYLWNRQKERDQQHGRDKRQVEAPSTRSDKRPHDGDPWPDQQWTGGNWWQHGSGSGSSSRWNWRKRWHYGWANGHWILLQVLSRRHCLPLSYSSTALVTPCWLFCYGRCQPSRKRNVCTAFRDRLNLMPIFSFRTQ